MEEEIHETIDENEMKQTEFANLKHFGFLSSFPRMNKQTEYKWKYETEKTCNEKHSSLSP